MSFFKKKKLQRELFIDSIVSMISETGIQKIVNESVKLITDTTSITDADEIKEQLSFELLSVYLYGTVFTIEKYVTTKETSRNILDEVHHKILRPFCENEQDLINMMAECQMRYLQYYQLFREKLAEKNLAGKIGTLLLKNILPEQIVKENYFAATALGGSFLIFLKNIDQLLKETTSDYEL